MRAISQIREIDTNHAKKKKPGFRNRAFTFTFLGSAPFNDMHTLSKWIKDVVGFRRGNDDSNIILSLICGKNPDSRVKYQIVLLYSKLRRSVVVADEKNRNRAFFSPLLNPHITVRKKAKVRFFQPRAERAEQEEGDPEKSHRWMDGREKVSKQGWGKTNRSTTDFLCLSFSSARFCPLPSFRHLPEFSFSPLIDSTPVFSVLKRERREGGKKSAATVWSVGFFSRVKK